MEINKDVNFDNDTKSDNYENTNSKKNFKKLLKANLKEAAAILPFIFLLYNGFCYISNIFMLLYYRLPYKLAFEGSIYIYNDLSTFIVALLILFFCSIILVCLYKSNYYYYSKYKKVKQSIIIFISYSICVALFINDLYNKNVSIPDILWSISFWCGIIVELIFYSYNITKKKHIPLKFVKIKRVCIYIRYIVFYKFIKRNTKLKISFVIKYYLIYKNILIILIPYFGLIFSLYEKKWLCISLSVILSITIAGAYNVIIMSTTKAVAKVAVIISFLISIIFNNYISSEQKLSVIDNTKDIIYNGKPLDKDCVLLYQTKYENILCEFKEIDDEIEIDATYYISIPRTQILGIRRKEFDKTTFKNKND